MFVRKSTYNDLLDKHMKSVADYERILLSNDEQLSEKDKEIHDLKEDMTTLAISNDFLSERIREIRVYIYKMACILEMEDRVESPADDYLDQQENDSLET